MPQAVREQKPQTSEKKGVLGMTRDQQDRWAWRFVDVVIGVVLVLAMFIGKNIVDDQRVFGETQAKILERLAAVESNRFTAKDGLEVWREIARIREQIAKMPSEVPPAWFKDYVDNLAARLDRIEIRLDEIEIDQVRGRP